MKLGISNRNLCAFLSADSDRGGLRMYASAHLPLRAKLLAGCVGEFAGGSGWRTWPVPVRLFLILYPRLLGWLKICGDVGGMVTSTTKLSNSSAGALLQDGASPALQPRFTT
jgi:hypothetical protein